MRRGSPYLLPPLLLLAAASVFLPVSAREAPAGPAAVPGSFREMTDLRSACRLKEWQTFLASGYDRGGGFYDSGNFLRIEGPAEAPRYVLMECSGPGVIDRMWFTRKSAAEPYELRIFLNGEKEPRLRIDLEALCAGERAPFLRPFAGQVDLARYVYVPVGFRNGCRVELVPTAAPDRYQYRENSAGKRIPHVYYQLTYRRLPPGSPVREFTEKLDPEEQGALTQAARLWNARGADPWEALDEAGKQAVETAEYRGSVPPGKSVPLFERAGAGVIRGLTLRLPEGISPRGLWLEIYWDGASRVAVAAPLDVAMAAPDPRQEVRGLWAGCRGGEYYCYLPMPYRKGARITLRSEATAPIELQARLRYTKEVPAPDDAYFHLSRYDHSPPLGPGDYLVLETTGRGHFVGLVMDRPGNMEGDDRFYVDGESSPSLHGTGTEDYFNFAWGFGHLASLPLHGVTRHFGSPVLYRYQLPAGVPFRKSLRAGFEHGHGNQHEGRYSGVAVYYHTSPG